MRFFVTGATGFVGSHLVDALLERGHEVGCLVRSEAKFRSLFPDKAPHPIQGNLDDRSALSAGCEGVDIVVHSAALTAARSRKEFLRVNVEATRRLLETAGEVAPDLKRFLYVSSQAAAGPAIAGVAKREVDPPAPVSNYGASKLAAEELVRQSGLPWSVVRPPSVYGPRDTSFLTVFRIARHGVIPAFGSADQELSLVYVHDLIDALLAVIESATSESRVYFASHPDTVTSRRLATLIYRAAKQLPQEADETPLVITLPGKLTRAVMTLTGAAARLAGKATMLSRDKARELLADAWTCDPSAIREDLGWQAKVDLESGTRATADWYRRQGLL